MATKYDLCLSTHRLIMYIEAGMGLFYFILYSISKPSQKLSYKAKVITYVFPLVYLKKIK